MVASLPVDRTCRRLRLGKGHNLTWFLWTPTRKPIPNGLECPVDLPFRSMEFCPNSFELLAIRPTQ